MSDVTRILDDIGHGDPSASERLLPLVYDELRKLAAQRLAKEPPGHTLQATALVHEAYVRLVDAEHQQKWDSRGHFFAAAAEAMRRLLVDSARRKLSQKRGGGRQRVDVELPDNEDGPPSDDLLALDDALKKLEAKDARKSKLVELRFFSGLTTEQAAEALGVSVATAERDWTFARAWLRREMSGDGSL
jgi:RNA polymerase sigma factor (TIGR02999 family)